MRRALAILADDVTGALMVAGYLEAAGIASPVAFDASAAIPAAPVAIAGLRTRTVAADDALAQLVKASDALLAAGYDRLAYKACATFDSTADGNIGLAADYLAGRLGVGPVFFSAGFPRLGTTVHQGYLFYRGRLVSESIKRFDPLTPMSDPDLVRFVGLQTPHPVRLVEHAVLRQGEAAACACVEAMLSQGIRHVFFDASDDGDVETSARIAASIPSLVAASDPMIIAYARLLAGGEAGAAGPPPRHGQGPAAVIAGSVGPVVLAQLAAFSALHPVLTVDLLAEQDEDALVSDTLDRAAAHVGRPFAVSTAADEDGVARAQAAFGAIGAARRAERILGAVARGLHARGVRRFVVAGGETSGAVVEALGLASVRALPEGPLGTGFCVAGEGPERISLYLKPGKLGADDILLRALDAMDGDREV